MVVVALSVLSAENGSAEVLRCSGGELVISLLAVLERVFLWGGHLPRGVETTTILSSLSDPAAKLLSFDILLVVIVVIVVSHDCFS